MCPAPGQSLGTPTGRQRSRRWSGALGRDERVQQRSECVRAAPAGSCSGRPPAARSTRPAAATGAARLPPAAPPRPAATGRWSRTREAICETAARTRGRRRVRAAGFPAHPDETPLPRSRRGCLRRRHHPERRRRLLRGQRLQATLDAIGIRRAETMLTSGRRASLAVVRAATPSGRSSGLLGHPRVRSGRPRRRSRPGSSRAGSASSSRGCA